jgi:hypothetical protein
LTPFAAALLVAGRGNLISVAALGAALALFLTREPLLALARQHWIWRDRRPENALALRWMAALGPTLIIFGAALGGAWGLPPVAALGSGAVALTICAVWMALRNRQRSVWLQTLSCGGLTFTAVLAARSVTDSFPLWAWWLWGLCWLQGVAGILVVHTRLDAISVRRTGTSDPALARASWLAVGLLAGVAAALAAHGSLLLAAAPALAAAAHGLDLTLMNLDTKLRVVGLRSMALSIVYAAIAALALR